MALELLDLTSRVAIVTGAGRGIGQAIALVLAEAGAKVVCTARLLEQIEETAAQIRSANGNAVAIVADVTQRADLQNLVNDTMARYGRIDIAVNNAGGMKPGSFLDITDDEFRYHFEWNTMSAFMLSQLAAREMLKLDGGAILNISSIAGHVGVGGTASYAVAKAGIEQLTRTMAQELGPKIRVNAIAPGGVLTSAMERRIAAVPEFANALMEVTPMKMLADPKTLGMLALFLCSPAAGFITGAVYNVDGGLLDPNRRG